MTPFNLQRALAGDPVITRDESEVINLSKTPSGLILGEENGEIRRWGQNGTYRHIGSHPLDLFMKEESTTEPKTGV